MKRILNIASVILIFAFLFPSTCMERIEPGAIGVRRSLEGGISKEDFKVGYHLSLPFWHSWYQLNGTVHYLEFLDNTQNALELRTSENNTIYIDLTIPYRIRDNEGWMIVREGFIDSYPAKVRSTAVGILREQLAVLSNLDVQKPEKRKEVAERTKPLLNEALKQYHVEATHVIIRSIRFRKIYEAKLQNKQLYIVQGRLAEVKQSESMAKQITDTLEKVIVKDINLKREEWNQKVEETRSEYEIDIAKIRAEATRYSRKRRAEADAMYAEFEAEGDLAEALAAALDRKSVV